MWYIHMYVICHNVGNFHLSQVSVSDQKLDAERSGGYVCTYICVGATLSQEELSDSAFSCWFLGNYERHTDRPTRPKNLRKHPPLGKPRSWQKMAKNHDATSDFITANLPLMLAPRNLDHFHN